MKRFLIILSLICSVYCNNSNAQGILNKIKNKVNQRKDQKIDNGIDKGLDKAEATAVAKPANNTIPTASVDQHKDTIPSATTPMNTAAFKAYNNYDFIAGDTIVFEDAFIDDQQGEFPAHWNLGAGQAVMNSVGEQKALLLTEGNFVHVSPLIKSPMYFADAFTIEFDWYFNGSYGPHIYLYNNSSDAKAANNPLGSITLDHEAAGVTVESQNIDLGSPFPVDIKGEGHYNSWHHVAIAFKKNQLKVYIDQYRVLVVPNLGIAPHAFDVEGIGDMDKPIVLNKFRIARGAGMNMLGKKFTDTKIVTHGINFDVNKAVIKPESMGTLNGIVQIMKDNPEIKFEVGGHTDSDGDDAANLKLSQARADAVRNQLIEMNVDAARLTTKGYGETKPMSDNTSPEGKANNRRVEFVKK